MIGRIAAVAVAACIACTGAGAATLDFAGEADNNGERGLDSGDVLGPTAYVTMAVTLTSSDHPYLDAGDAGLGVCKVLTASDQCDPSNDDNLTEDEWVTLTFASAVNLSGLSFDDDDHNSLNASMRTLMIGINGGTLGEYSFLDAVGETFMDITSITFAWGGSDPDNYYIKGATASPIPVPASLPLLVGALGLIGFGARRQRKRS